MTATRDLEGHLDARLRELAADPGVPLVLSPDLAKRVAEVIAAARAFYPTTIADDQHSDEGHRLWLALVDMDQAL